MRSRAANIPLKSFAQILTAGSGTDFCPLSRCLSSGNRKLPSSTAIFNMGPAKTCPALALGLCKAFSSKGKHICYARKAEILYPDVLPYRIAQEKYWKQVTAEDFAWQFLCMNALKKTPWDKLRLNESGDFHSQACIEKADTIARLLGRFGIKTYGYTHRSDLDYTGVKHMIVSGSNFHKAGIDNVFQMVEDVKRDKPKGWSVCAMDCKICSKCSKRGQKIVVPMH